MMQVHHSGDARCVSGCVANRRLGHRADGRLDGSLEALQHLTGRGRIEIDELGAVGETAHVDRRVGGDGDQEEFLGSVSPEGPVGVGSAGRKKMAALREPGRAPVPARGEDQPGDTRVLVQWKTIG